MLPLVPVALPGTDEWILQTIGLYTAEVTIRRQEHACLDQLRKGGVIR